MAIEIVDLPIQNGDFPVRYVSLPEGIIIFDGFFMGLMAIYNGKWLVVNDGS